jgi:F-type H+-transporting ATPase subunit delta
MDGTSRESMRAALARFEEQVGRSSGGAGAQEISEGLYAVASLLDREPALRAALTDPGLPDERKTGLLETLLGSRAQPATVRLVEVAVTRPRGRSLETVLEELIRLAAARRHRLVAHVRVAAPLDAAQSERLSAVLARIYSRNVQLQVDVDPAVLGGVEVRVGDEVLDGTVQHRLDDARRRVVR